MDFIIEKKDKLYYIKENGRLVFTSDYCYEEKLLSLYLRNLYGDEALSMFQIKKWYSTIYPSRALDFTIYEQDIKMGELHSFKGGFEFIYQGVAYRFYSGMVDGVRVVKCFDRDKICATMVFDNEIKLSFSNSTLGSLLSILAILLHGFIKCEHFSQELFISKCTNLNM